MNMSLRHAISTSIALSAITLTICAIPAQAAQPTKIEPAATAETGAASQALAVEAAGARASQLAEQHSGLGAYYDESTNEHVLVMSGRSGLTPNELSAIGAPARVEQRSITNSTVAAIQARIASRSFHADAARYNYASYLDLQTGKVVLETNAPAAVTASLRAQYAGAIELRAENVTDAFSRRADSPPFWGGSSIKSGGATCTSGFVVQRSGVRYLTTAAHCFGLGANVLTSDGNRSVGTVRQRGPIPPFDMELIGGQSYGSFIFSGGTNSSTGKHVIGAGDPVVGFTGYCHSGQTTGENCGHRVDSVTAQVCTQTGCKSPVIRWSQGRLIQGGDSGSPFYLPSGSNAYIRGMNIAISGSSAYAEKWSRISSHLGVTIVT
jgi:hypothetical protein